MTWRRNRSREPELAELLDGLALDGPPQFWEAVKPPGDRGEPTLRAFLSRDLLGAEWRWHISVNGGGRVARWDELAGAAHAIRPGVVFVIGVPPRSWWLNVHEHVLHLWEVRDDALTEQWRGERAGMAPT